MLAPALVDGGSRVHQFQIVRTLDGRPDAACLDFATDAGECEALDARAVRCADPQQPVDGCHMVQKFALKIDGLRGLRWQDGQCSNRDRQPDKPSRPEAIRRLLDVALGQQSA